MTSVSPLTDRTCRVCAAAARPLFRGRVLDHNVEYQECDACGYVQTETPYWLAQAYAEPINRSDTGLLRRNARNTSIVMSTLMLVGGLRGQVIDCAGGYGVLVRMLRDRGVNAHWHDPHCQNLLARGFEAGDEERADLVTAFEVLEHFMQPQTELARLLGRADNVLVSTDLIAEPTPAADDWWYYGPEHGQHIGFFRRRTLEHLAQQAGCWLHTDGRQFHLFTRQRIAPWHWAVARKAHAIAPLLARARLRSKVWSDLATARDQALAAFGKPPAP